ncbi:MAG TPA: hypothetical protein VGQ28_00995 [Thermoanaerobaculia bacterium]|jgi:hypothetical protein|nr:hypothetical protein [Thermoanaerobaculia bacterium]
MKKQLKKIALAKETLRNLSGSEMRKAEGAAFPNSDVKTCVCHTVSCHPGLC